MENTEKAEMLKFQAYDAQKPKAFERSKEETAIREVKEETGANASIVQPLSPQTYWFAWEGQKVKKTVYFYVMNYVDGDVTEHDFEMEEVEWVPFDQVDGRLTYSSDKKVWEEARQIIK